MITEEKVYSIKCDECGNFFCCPGLNTDKFKDKEYAEYHASEEGWFIKDGKHLCPDCYLEKYREKK